MSRSHITHMNESCHTRERVAHMNESYHAYELIHMCVKELYHAYERAMSHMWTGHVTHVRESRHTCEWVMSHMWMSHVTRVNESCHTCEWVKFTDRMPNMSKENHIRKMRPVYVERDPLKRPIKETYRHSVETIESQPSVDTSRIRVMKEWCHVTRTHTHILSLSLSLSHTHTHTHTHTHAHTLHRFIEDRID